MARYERWTAIVSAGLIFGALLACKKKGSEATEASASAAAAAAPPPAPAEPVAVHLHDEIVAGADPPAQRWTFQIGRSA